jgi:hypothetical protein
MALSRGNAIAMRFSCARSRQDLTVKITEQVDSALIYMVAWLFSA